MDSTCEIDPNRPIVLFDGVCNLCNFFVNFIIDRDKKQEFLFGSLQSDQARKLLIKYDVDSASLKTVVLIDQEKVFVQSTAALRVIRKLGFPWVLFYGFIIFPKGFRDWVYDWISRNRYRWFGKKDSCRVPTPELRQRFLDS